MTAKQKTDNDPAAAVETARAEHEAAQNELQAFDIHKGGLNEAASRRRELSERVEIARERLQMAQARFDEAEFARIEGEIDELQGDAQQIENELALAREKAEADLREHLNGDWLAGTGRFSTQRPAIGELLGYCTSVNEVESRRHGVLNVIRRQENRIRERKAQRDRERKAAEVEQRRDSIQAAIRSLGRRIGDRRQELARQAAAARTDARRKLISGEAVEIPLTPWRVECMAGFVQDVLDGLALRFIPGALPSPVEPIIHVLIPSGSQPRGWIDGTLIETAEPMPPAELCPALAAVWSRATASKKSGAKANR